MIPSAPLGTDAAAGRPQGLGAAPGAGPEQAAAERRFRFELAAHPGSPAQARRLARARLTGWSVCEDTCDTAALVISELVTNAIVHTASDVVVCELLDGDDVLRIAVRDQGCAPDDPHPSPQRPEEEHGRGLLLVEALCHAWGAQEHGSGLLVWADLPRGADEPAEAAEPGADASAEEARERKPEQEQAVPRPGGGEAREHGEPRDDLGWGARPKPGPAEGSGDEDEAVEQSHRDRAPMGGARVPRPAPSPGAAEAYAAELIRRTPLGAPKPLGRTPVTPPAKGNVSPDPKDHLGPEPKQHLGPEQRTAGPYGADHRIPEQRAANPFAPDRRAPEQRVSDLCVLDHHGPSHHALDQSPFAHAPAGHTWVSHSPLTHRTADHRLTDHRPTDHRTADHRTTDHRPADHRPADHRPTDHRPADHRKPDHRPVDHRTADLRTADHHPAGLRTADHRPADLRTADHRTPDHRALDAHCVDERGAEQLPPVHSVTAHSPAPVGEASVPRPFPGSGGGSGLPALERSRERGRA